MKIAYFDCFAGIAGDMALGALIDCGVPLDELRRALQTIPVHGWELHAKPVLKSGIHALQIRIALHGQSDAEELAHHHHHDHGHHDPDSPHHDHGHHHDHHHEHRHGATMAEIRSLITASSLSARVQETSLAIFERIAIAEAHQHHTTPDQVHFHEIGGVDSLLDICGVAWCLDYLNIDKIYASPLPLSRGFVDCAHGRMPVPAPAVMELLKGKPVYSTGLEGEMITPTGAGILDALCQHFGEPPAMQITAVGCGAGSRNWPDRPNMLRVTLGEAAPGKSTFKDELEQEELILLQTNIDDMNPQLYEDVWEQLWRGGALDAWLQPVQMKKGRPGVKLEVLCQKADADVLLKVLLQQTTSLGVRQQRVERFSLSRRIEKVETALGEIEVKLALDGAGQVLRVQPEYESMRQVAQQLQLPLVEVEKAAQAAIGLRWPRHPQNAGAQKD